MDRVRDALKWLGINQSDLMPTYEQVYIALVRIAKRTKKPVRSVMLAQEVGRRQNRTIDVLNELKFHGRVERVKGGWIPLR